MKREPSASPVGIRRETPPGRPVAPGIRGHGPLGGNRPTAIGPNPETAWRPDSPSPSRTGSGWPSAESRLVVSLARKVPQMVIVAETAAQRSRARELPALELFDGSCFERLRARVGTSLPHRLRVFILTTRRGLVGANQRLRPYEPARFGTDGLRKQIRETLHPYLDLCPVEEMLLLMAPHYLDVLPRVTGHAGQVHTIVDPVRGWSRAAALLDRWGWP